MQNNFFCLIITLLNTIEQDPRSPSPNKKDILVQIKRCHRSLKLDFWFDFYVTRVASDITDVGGIVSACCFYSRTFAVLRSRPLERGGPVEQNKKTDTRKRQLSRAFGLISVSYVFVTLPRLIVGYFDIYYEQKAVRISSQYPDNYS